MKVRFTVVTHTFKGVLGLDYYSYLVHDSLTDSTHCVCGLKSDAELICELLEKHYKYRAKTKLRYSIL